MHRTSCTLHVLSFILTQTALEVGVTVIIFQVKKLSQSHRASKQQSWDSDPDLSDSSLCSFYHVIGSREVD